MSPPPGEGRGHALGSPWPPPGLRIHPVGSGLLRAVALRVQLRLGLGELWTLGVGTAQSSERESHAVPVGWLWRPVDGATAHVATLLSAPPEAKLVPCGVGPTPAHTAGPQAPGTQRLPGGTLPGLGGTPGAEARANAGGLARSPGCHLAGVSSGWDEAPLSLPSATKQVAGGVGRAPACWPWEACGLGWAVALALPHSPLAFVYF